VFLSKERGVCLKGHMGVEEEASSFLHAPRPGIKRTGLSSNFFFFFFFFFQLK
jgi:hypothetical protein